MPITIFELHIRRLPDNSLAADAELTSLNSTQPTQLARDVPIVLDEMKLNELTNDPDAYGAKLSAQLFADRSLRRA